MFISGEIKMLVTVIMPIYKVEEYYLRNSIESILVQTYKKLEIILVDDGSPDNCGAVCDEYASRDERIKVYHLPNGGVSVARNYGLDHCHGDYIMFVDSDDYIANDYIQHLYELLQKNNVDCVCSKCRYVTSVDLSFKKQLVNKYIRLTKIEALEELFYLNRVNESLEISAVWATLYKRQVLENIRFEPNVIMAEDFLFKYRIFQNISELLVCNYDGYFYLQRRTSVMHSGFNKKKLNILNCLQKYISKIDSLLKIGFISRSVNIAFSILMIIPMTEEFKSEREMVIMFIKKYRWAVLVQSKAKLKVKGACFLSIFGFKLTQYMFMYLKSNLGGK